MSASGKHDVLQLMAELDFNAPINTTVIVYESDDEVIGPSNEKEKNNAVKTVEHSTTVISEDKLNASNKRSEETITCSKKRRLSNKNDAKNNKKKKEAESSTTKRAITDNAFQNQTKSIDKDHPNNINNNQSNPEERQSSDNNPIITNSLRHFNNDQVLVNTTANTSTNQNFINTYQSGYSNQNKINILQSSYNNEAINSSQNFNSSQVRMNTTQGNNPMHPLVSVSAFPYQNDIYVKANDCIQTLLHTVSTHLIFILKAYSDYAAIFNRNPEKKVLEAAKKHYLETKSHLFYLSFGTVSNIILQKEKDVCFIDSFIDNTVKYAKLRNCDFKNYEVRYLFGELITWVKSHNQNPILTKLLDRAQPQTQTSNSVICRQQQEKTKIADKPCIFRSEGGPTGDPGRELVMNLNTTIRNPLQQSQTLSEQNLYTSRQSEQQTSLEVRNSANLATTNPKTFVQEFQSFSTRNYRMNNQTPMTQLSSKKHQNMQQIDNSHAITQEVTLPLWQQEQNHSMNQWITSVHNSSNQKEQEQDNEGNRSLSRDSGFMSPLSSLQTDPMCTSPGNRNVQNDPLSAIVTPMITHVTSLNPGVAFINDGTCHVCGKPTKHMCMGCYKYYYCSHQCQIDDWSTHAWNCNTN